MEMPKGAKTQVIRNVSYIFIDKPYWNTKKNVGSISETISTNSLTENSSRMESTCSHFKKRLRHLSKRKMLNRVSASSAGPRICWTRDWKQTGNP